MIIGQGRDDVAEVPDDDRGGVRRKGGQSDGKGSLEQATGGGRGGREGDVPGEPGRGGCVDA